MKKHCQACSWHTRRHLLCFPALSPLQGARFWCFLCSPRPASFSRNAIASSSDSLHFRTVLSWGRGRRFRPSQNPRLLQTPNPKAPPHLWKEIRHMCDARRRIPRTPTMLRCQTSHCCICAILLHRPPRRFGRRVAPHFPNNPGRERVVRPGGVISGRRPGEMHRSRAATGNSLAPGQHKHIRRNASGSHMPWPDPG